MSPGERKAWLEWRRKGLGGTDISAIRGEHPRRSPWDVWMSKLYEVDAPDRPEFAIGRWLERPIAEWAGAELGMLLEDAPPVVGPERWMRVSPDFHLIRDDGQRTLLEVKTDLFPGEKWGEAPEGRIPSHYRDQVLWQLELAPEGVDPTRAIVAVYLAGARDRRLYVVEADPERQAEFVRFGRTWWAHHVQGHRPPEPDASGACRDGLGVLHPEHTGRMRVASAAEEDAARVLAEVEGQIADLGRHRDQLRNYLRARIGDDEGLRFTGGRAKWSRKSNRLTVRIRK